MNSKEKLILHNHQSPGDILMLTAALRDLHRAYPLRFLTDVRTSVPALWEGNPFLHSLSDDEDGVERVECEYPLVHSSNANARHFITAFHHNICSTLNLDFELTEFRGDVHLSAQESLGPPGVLRERMDGGYYWVVAAGGKFDFTAKWWPTEYYQDVIDQMKGEVTFVQVGSSEHYHPQLNGVIDLRGMTSTRDLISLIYWSSGVLCPITFAMHLAAAVPINPRVRFGLRPCVVVAGGREPQAWESYPGHQFLDTIGLLPCCADGACWKSRTFRLNDGRDEEHGLCERPVGDHPECMRMISPDDVVRAIRRYQTIEAGLTLAPPPSPRILT